MTLYFDTKVEFFDSNVVSTLIGWHASEPLFAVAYTQERGGSVTIFADSGEPQRDVTYPVHPTAQATALTWHPDKVLLATGWENGDIHVWLAGHREFASVQGPHKTAIVLLEFSEQGGRMVTADAAGLVTGWRCDGQYQFLTMFSHDLRATLLHITFRRTVDSEVRDEMINLAKAAVAGDENALDVLTNWRPRTAARNLTHAGVKDNHCFYVVTKPGLVYYINQGGTCSEVLKNNTTPIMQMLWHPRKDAVICLMEDMTVVLHLVESTGILTELDRVKLSGRISGKMGAICWASHCLAIVTGDFSVRIWDVERNDNYLLRTELPNAGNSLGKSSASSTTADRNGSSSTKQFFSPDSENSSSVSSGGGPAAVGHRKGPKPLNEIFTCLAYCQSNQILCAGTNLGNLFTWKHHSSSVGAAEDESWQLTNISNVRGAIKQCVWGFNELAKPCILSNCISNVYVLKEQPLLSCHTRELWAVQQHAKTVYLEHSNGRCHTVQTDFAITAMALNQMNLIVSNGRSIGTYNIERTDKDADLDVSDEVESSNAITISNTPSLSMTIGVTSPSSGEERLRPPPPSLARLLVVKLMQIFTAECLSLQVHNQNIFCLTASNVIIYSIGGVVLNKIQANDTEGKIIGMDLTGAYLTVFTMNGFIRAYDVSRHDPRQLFPGKSGYDLFEDFGEVIVAKCNSIGTHLAMVIANCSFVPQPVLYCWNFERNNLLQYNLTEAAEGNRSSLPVHIAWDTDESRLLAMEVKSIHQQQQKENSGNKKQRNGGSSSQSVESEIMIVFYSEDNEDEGKLRVLERRSLNAVEQLINLCVPNVITLNINLVKTTPLQDFNDLRECDANTRKLVLNFSLHVAEGNMDLAYRCIRTIKSRTIWTNLARMCVQTGRLDVAKICLGHLDKARSVRALRQAIDDEDLETEAKLAVLASELGMHEKARALYRNCGRFDLLNKLMKASGQLDEAIKIAETEDRVHLKNTYYHKAVALRDAGDIKGALEYFEKTQNPVQNITQMLLENPTAMKRYMQTTTDPKMLKWWGQYVESSGDMDAALAVYQKADDWFSQVKILCYLGKIAKADAIARQSGDRAACYHLARHYENVGKFQEAIMFYTRAQTFSNAIRICKENDFQDELWTVASSSRNRDRAIAAAYFEECGAFKRAVELYHRAGMIHKALEMAFDSEQPEILEIIASELTAHSDEELINRCADFFNSIEQHQKAVHLLAKTKHPERALAICLDKGVPITEELAEMLTPPKDAPQCDEATRVHILTQLGELLQQQGDYHTATKKFTQAGDKVRAMKSLLKSGNTEKIIFFASMSRQREVYIMAANYLQALNWQDDANVLKHIVTFYSKGQAYDSLANFYAICSQIEIEEFHDYEKALKAMLEAAKCLEKLSHSQQALSNLQRTIGDVRNILEIQNLLRNGDNQAVIAGCRSMLIKPEMPPIRQADILSMLVRAFVYTKQYNEAAGALKELAVKEPAWSSSGIIDKALVQRIAKECNLDFDIIWNSGRGRQRRGGTTTTTTASRSTSAYAGSDEDENEEDERGEEIQEELH